MRSVLLRASLFHPTIIISMEQHPVPQNVTTFQFRLIGDMTIKQFGYLAGGAIVAYICYKLPLPFFFTWPLTISSAVLGVGLAFVPIEERPMDIWILSFFKSVYSPTQFVWTREEKIQSTNPTNLPIRPIENKIPPEIPPAGRAGPARSPLSMLQKWFGPRANIHPTAPVAATQSRILSMQQPQGAYTLPATHTFSVPPTTPVAIPRPTEPHPEVLELQKQLAEMQTHRTKMEQEIAAMREVSKASEMSKAPVEKPREMNFATTTPQAASEISKTMEQPRVTFMTQDVAVKAGVPRLSAYPNVVAGILKDSDGNLLPGVLVTVRDEEGMPLRALKTNKLGQFAASTPLPNGTYIVEIEDPRARFTFDRIKIVLVGSVAPTIEIIAKSQKELSRDKIAKELFGKPL